MADGKKSHKILFLEDVPPDVERELEAICQLAWDGIVEQKLTFTSDAVSVDTLGLMHAVKELHSRRGRPVLLPLHPPDTTGIPLSLPYKSAPTGQTATGHSGSC